jgi:hypothetical protein
MRLIASMLNYVEKRAIYLAYTTLCSNNGLIFIYFYTSFALIHLACQILTPAHNGTYNNQITK